MTFPVRTLFACWVTVVATGTVVHHRHAGAGRSHGFGWATLSPAQDSTGVPFAHRHTILFGVESGAIPDEDTSDSTPLDGSLVGPSSGSETSSGPDEAVLVSPIPPVPCVFCLAPPAVAPSAPARGPAASSDCALTSHARSGVLRS